MLVTGDCYDPLTELADYAQDRIMTMFVLRKPSDPIKRDKLKRPTWCWQRTHFRCRLGCYLCPLANGTALDIGRRVISHTRPIIELRTCAITLFNSKMTSSRCSMILFKQASTQILICRHIDPVPALSCVVQNIMVKLIGYLRHFVCRAS
jgi:hypothetical protein